MKIQNIQISNYRAFYGKYDIPVNGKNLLIYGENGSGKSSFFHAVSDFFLSSITSLEDLPFNENEWNKRNPTTVEKQIALTFDNQAEPYYFNPDKQTPNDMFLKDIGNQNPFLTYSRLIKTYLTDKGGVEKQIFELLINDIVGRYVSSKGKKIIDYWTEFVNLKNKRDGVNWRVRDVQNRLKDFNKEFKKIITDVVKTTNEYLKKYFKNGIELEITVNDFKSVATKVFYLRNEVKKQVKSAKVDIKIKLFGEPIDDYNFFLNEARLSALAISMYLASLKVIPEPQNFKILFLDDVFIGLDNGNRMPLLDIIKSVDFKDWQVFITTYDKYWFEIAKRYLQDNQWNKFEMYVCKDKENDLIFEKPIVIPFSDNYFQKAEKYKKAKDYPACANYLRKELERLIKERLPDEFLRSDGKPPAISHLWSLCIERYKGISITVNPKIIEDFKTSRLMLLNPLSHDSLEAPVYESEIQRAFNLIEEINNLPIIQKIILLSKGMKLKFTHPSLIYTFELELIQDFYIDKNGIIQNVKLPKCKIITWQYNGNEYWDIFNNKPLQNMRVLDTEHKLEKIIENHVNLQALSLTKQKFLKNTWYANIWSLKEIYSKAGV